MDTFGKRGRILRWCSAGALVFVSGLAVFFLISEEKNGGQIKSNVVETESGVVQADLAENTYTALIKLNGSQAYGKNAVSYTYEGDFDGNGTNEAFVVIGNNKEDSYGGDLWFVNEEEKISMLEQYVSMQDERTYWKVDGQTHLFFDIDMGNPLRTAIYGVQKTAAVDKLPVEGMAAVDENGGIVCDVRAYDGSYMLEDNVFVGQTIKPYQFTYRDGRIVEVQGKEISEEEIKELGDIKEVEEIAAELESDNKKDVYKQYILRENGELQINFAQADESEIVFSCMMCRLNEEKVWENLTRGEGFYEISLSKDAGGDTEKRWVSEVIEEAGGIPAEINRDEAADVTEEESSDAADESGSSEEGSPVVGVVFVPDADLLERINAAENYVENWNENMQNMTEENMLTAEKVMLVCETDGFRVYGTDDWQTMLLEAPDGTWVRSENNPLTSNYQIQPRAMEKDYDEDGEQELAIITTVAHGTGVYIEYLFMADRDENGEWCMYQFDEEDYLEQLEEHFDTAYRKEGVGLRLDGELVGEPQEIEKERIEKNYRYSAGAQIRFSFEQNEFTEEKIQLEAELVGCAEDEIPELGDYPGHILYADVNYQGKGEWQLYDIRYVDRQELYDTMVAFCTACFSGDLETVQEHLVEDYSDTVECYDEIKAMEGTEFYRIKGLNDNRTYQAGDRVMASLEFRVGREDSFTYLSVELEKQSEGWRVTSYGLEK